MHAYGAVSGGEGVVGEPGGRVGARRLAERVRRQRRAAVTLKKRTGGNENRKVEKKNSEKRIYLF